LPNYFKSLEVETMPAKGKTIQIYLPDGNPRGIRLAEITSRSILATLIPRSLLDASQKRKELDNVGIYFLVGAEEGEDTRVYIGEAENVLNRLKQHNKKLDFWQKAIVITSKSQDFSKTHVKYLESLCCEEAKRINRYGLENGTAPKRPHVSESVKDDLYDYFETLKILISTLGSPVFDEFRVPTAKELLYCEGKESSATGELTEDGFIIFKDSTCKLGETKGAQKWVSKTKLELLNKKVLVKGDKGYRFTQDHLFKTPSGAAGLVLGANANGWIRWKYKNGKTLDEVKRK
jgi:hypothetical protein